MRACMYACVDRGRGGRTRDRIQGRNHWRDRDAINYPSMRIFSRKVYACILPSLPFLRPRFFPSVPLDCFQRPPVSFPPPFPGHTRTRITLRHFLQSKKDRPLIDNSFFFTRCVRWYAPRAVKNHLPFMRVTRRSFDIFVKIDLQNCGIPDAVLTFCEQGRRRFIHV